MTLFKSQKFVSAEIKEKSVYFTHSQTQFLWMQEYVQLLAKWKYQTAVCWWMRWNILQLEMKERANNAT